MRIGILTYHRSHNYGALLQALALRRILSEMGHEVFFIDYWPKYHQRVYSLFSIRKVSHGRIKDRWRYLMNFIRYCSSRKKRINSFITFIKKYIDPNCVSADSFFDLVIHGSDQIWRKQPELRTFNPIYFGKNNISARIKISYAASMGILSNNSKDDKLVKEYLSELVYISVRESELKNYVVGLGFNNVRIDLDPTLLLTGKRWKELFGIGKEKIMNYVLFYDLMACSFNKEELTYFARSKGLELWTLYGNANRPDIENGIKDADPVRFLELIDGADFIFTSSFHGLVFSILFRKPFYASFCSNSGRAQSLLQNLGLSEYLIAPGSAIPSKYHPIDYDVVYLKLEDLRQTSLRYLSEVTTLDADNEKGERF